MGKMLISALFGGLCLTFAGIAVAPWLIDPLDYLAPGGGGAAAPDIEIRTVRPATLEAPAFDSLAIIVERPLFTATRRPAPDIEPTPVLIAQRGGAIDFCVEIGAGERRDSVTGANHGAGLDGGCQEAIDTGTPGGRMVRSV